MLLLGLLLSIISAVSAANNHAITVTMGMKPQDYAKASIKLFSDYIKTGTLCNSVDLTTMDAWTAHISFGNKLYLFIKSHLTVDPLIWSEEEKVKAMGAFKRIELSERNRVRFYSACERVLQDKVIPKDLLKRLSMVADWFPPPQMLKHKLIYARLLSGDEVRVEDVAVREYEHFLLFKRYFPEENGEFLFDDSITAFLVYDHVDAEYAGRKSKMEALRQFQEIGFFEVPSLAERKAMFVEHIHVTLEWDKMQRDLMFMSLRRLGLLREFFRVACENGMLDSYKTMITFMDAMESYSMIREYDEFIVEAICKADNIYVNDWYSLAKHHPTLPSPKLVDILVKLGLVEPNRNEFVVRGESATTSLDNDTLLLIHTMVVRRDIYSWLSIRLVCKLWNSLARPERLLSHDNQLGQEFLQECGYQMPTGSPWKLIIDERERVKLFTSVLSKCIVTLPFTIKTPPEVPNNAKTLKLGPITRVCDWMSCMNNVAHGGYYFRVDLVPSCPKRVAVDFINIGQMDVNILPAPHVMALLLDNVIDPYCQDTESICTAVIAKYKEFNALDSLQEAILSRHLEVGCRPMTVECFLTRQGVEPTFESLVKLQPKQSNHAACTIDYHRILPTLLKTVVARKGDLDVPEDALSCHLAKVVSILVDMNVDDFSVVVQFMARRCPKMMNDTFMIFLLNNLLNNEMAFHQ